MSKCSLQAARIYHNRAAFHCGQRKTAVQQKRVCFPIPKLYMLQTGLESTAEKLPEQVQYDIRLSDSYLAVEEQYKSALTEPDLEAVVHVYDFRMTLKEMLDYIESGTLPERFCAISGRPAGLSHDSKRNNLYTTRCQRKKNRVHMLCSECIQRGRLSWTIDKDILWIC